MILAALARIAGFLAALAILLAVIALIACALTLLAEPSASAAVIRDLFDASL